MHPIVVNNIYAKIRFFETIYGTIYSWKTHLISVRIVMVLMFKVNYVILAGIFICLTNQLSISHLFLCRIGF